MCSWRTTAMCWRSQKRAQAACSLTPQVHPLLPNWALVISGIWLSGQYLQKCTQHTYAFDWFLGQYPENCTRHTCTFMSCAPHMSRLESSPGILADGLQVYHAEAAAVLSWPRLSA